MKKQKEHMQKTELSTTPKRVKNSSWSIALEGDIKPLNNSTKLQSISIQAKKCPSCESCLYQNKIGDLKGWACPICGNFWIFYNNDY